MEKFIIPKANSNPTTFRRVFERVARAAGYESVTLLWRAYVNTSDWQYDQREQDAIQLYANCKVLEALKLAGHSDEEATQIVDKMQFKSGKG